MLNPNPEKDGPVTVHLTNGDVLNYDRVFHTRSGMVQLYDVVRTDREHAGDLTRKGSRAISIPTHQIEAIEYTNFGGD